MAADISEYVVPQESDEYSIADITPTLLRYSEKKGSFKQGKVEAGIFGSKTKFYSLYDIQSLEYYCGKSLEEIVEHRLSLDLESFDRIIVVLIDGMNLNSMRGAGKNFTRKINFEFLPMSTSFPSMTTVATTSLLTGSFPIAHGIVADSFFNSKKKKVTKVKPYLSKDAQKYLPRILPVTTYFLLSDYWDKDCTLGIVTLGKAHEQLSDREFIDFFFGKEFELGGEFTKAMTNEGVYKATKQFILKNQGKKFFFLIVRFSIDYLAHLYGPQSEEARAEMERLFEYLFDLNSCLTKGRQRSLIFLTSDHGHKELDSGLVPISSITKFLAPDYKYIAANQTLLSLYHEDLHIDHPEYNFARMVRLKKKHSEFYYYEKSNEKWKLLNRKIEDIEPIVLSSEQYGIDNRVGDLVLHAENFYFAYHDISYYGDSDFAKFKSSHGGLSTQEIFVPCLFWSST